MSRAFRNTTRKEAASRQSAAITIQPHSDDTLPRTIVAAPALFLLALFTTAERIQPAGEKLVLSPAYPEIPPTFWEQHGVWIVLGSIVGIGLIGTAIWLKLRPQPANVIPIEVQTRQELESLRQQQPEDGQTLSQISRCLRRYLVAAFALAAGEVTTAELNQLLTASQSFGLELSGLLNDFFRRCDELKFSPASAASSGTAQQALELFESCERRRSELRASAAAKSSPVP